ncbi:MAG: multicopper oxidase domain-containing protein [Nitrososphaeraceae archaeon]
MLLFRVIEHRKNISLILLLSIIITISLTCQIGLFLEDTYAITTIDNISTHKVQHSNTINIIEQQEQEAFTPTKKITMILEDAEIEIAKGEKVKVWAFNGTVPGPTVRLTEGENVSILFVNKGSYPHTMHFHGIHDDKNDGVLPVIMPDQSYTYNITAEPAGALMYHCHVPPVSEHIRMGMYGALIIDPKDKPLKPAKEYYMVMSEFSTDEKNVTKFLADYYPINGYSYQYMKHPIEIKQGELLRIYLINMGTTIQTPMHLHSTIFDVYPSGLLSNEPYKAQTIAVAPGDAAIIEATWRYPGSYMFHSHGFQEENGNMGHILVKENTNVTKMTKSVSMFDWQYDLQKNLQQHHQAKKK